MITVLSEQLIEFTSSGKIRKNIRFGSTITNRLDNEASDTTKNTNGRIQNQITL